MKKIYQKIALILAVVMCCITPVSGINVYAEESTDTNIEQSKMDEVNSESLQESDATVTVDRNTQKMRQKSEDGVEVSEGAINYIGIDQPYLTSPDIQKIVVSYGKGTESISDARIVYQRTDGIVMEDTLTSRQDELFLFEHSFTKDDVGVYTLLEFKYVEDGVEYTIKLADIGIDAMFGVDEAYPGYNSDTQNIENATEDVSLSVVNVSAEDVDSIQDDVDEAISNTEDVMEEASGQSVSNGISVQNNQKENIVVVLDPGHGGSDSGAVGNGLQEKDLNLKIAQYCKQELEQYSGVTVYMTREGDTYLGDKDGDAASDIANRVKKAKEWGADILVSIHINSGGGKGVEVYYPNSNYNAEIGKEGQDTAQQISNELVKLGLTNRGIKIRTVNYDQYPDGSLEDWYGIIRRSKYAGFPGIIVEHAFIDNTDDASKLKDDSFLQECGIADATGIANHYGLSKGGWEKKKEGWKYKNGDGTYKISEWFLEDSTWYYFDANGIMQTGWLHLNNTWYYLAANGARTAGCWSWINGKCYYFDQDGCMASNAWIGDYYVDSSGAWVKGKERVTPGWKKLSGQWKYVDSNEDYVKSKWLQLEGKWYYFDEEGWMKTGWLKLGNVWYYFEANGAMLAGGWRWINGACYYFYNNGHMAADTWINGSYVNDSGAWVKGKQKETSGWKAISEKWKYVDSDGNYVKSKWLLLGPTWYYFDEEGWMKTGWLKLGNVWYYLETNGAMLAGGWRWINGACYYFYNDGHMAADAWIDGSYVNGSGAWVPDKEKLTEGWKEISGRKKYVEANGEYATSKWLEIDNVKYYFDADGWMQTGWVQLNDTWYYFDANGAWVPDQVKLTDIMGASSVTAAQLAHYFQSMNRTYPSYYAQHDSEAKTIEDFCQIYIEECKIEGVRAEVAFAQAMLETGYLSFGGDVDISQYNFAGMGATGNGVKGNSFSTVRIGVRAQVQHLKCYASTDKLNGTCVDPRWGEWLRGKAPYVEWLSIKNNPYGTGWASSATYADSIKSIMVAIGKCK